MSDSKVPGILVLGATHLGNPQDIPNRSLEWARTADLLVFEEDRPARLVLKTAGVHRDYLRFSEHHQKSTLEEVENSLRAGKSVLFMSDQGTPIVADPGADLVKIALRLKSRIEVIPGPCSITAALSVCSFGGREYFFVGFLPRENEQRETKLKLLSKLNVPLVMMDTPYRMKALIDSCIKVFGSDHRGFIAIDISGEKQTFLEGKFSSIQKLVTSLNEKLNFVLIVDR